MSGIPKPMLKINKKNNGIYDSFRHEIDENTKYNQQSNENFIENIDTKMLKTKKEPKKESSNCMIGDMVLTLSKNREGVKRTNDGRKNTPFDYDEDVDGIPSTSRLHQFTKFRKLRKDPKKRWNKTSVYQISASESTLTDVSSTEMTDGLSASSVLALYDTTLRSDNLKLKKMQLEIKRNYTSCFLKQELVKIATLCSTRAKDLLKPCPKIFMINNEPCYEELKFLLRNVRSLKKISSSKNSPFLDNRILLDIYYWAFFESNLPAFIEIKFCQIFNDLQKLDILRIPVRPSLVTKVKYKQYSSQEVAYRNHLKCLKQNEQHFEIKMGCISVHMQLLYQILSDGMDHLIQDKRGVPVHTNLIKCVEHIQENVYYLMNSNYNNCTNIIFEYCAILVTELIIRQDRTSLNSKDDITIYRDTVNTGECIYYVKNVRAIRTKYIFFFKLGCSKIFRKLSNIDKNLHVRYMQDGHGYSQNENHYIQRCFKSQPNTLALSISLNILVILLSIVSFICYMKTWRYF